jgi:hypothetical protein
MKPTESISSTDTKLPADWVPQGYEWCNVAATVGISTKTKNGVETMTYAYGKSAGDPETEK